jgi:hypothetical protein
VATEKQDRETEEDKRLGPAALRATKLSAPSINVDHTFAEMHPAHLERLSKHQLIYSFAGLVLGIVCVLGGIALFLNGIIGSTSWSAKTLGAESTISDAAPGAVLFVVGLFIVFITRYILRVKR